jgi:hypothetical protein
MWLSAIVKVEWGEASAALSAAVVRKLKGSEMKVPIMLSRGNISAKHVFHSAVNAFCLPICLGMVGCGKIEACSQALEQGLPKVAGESRVTVRDEDRRETKVTEDVIKEDVSIANGINGPVVGSIVVGTRMMHLERRSTKVMMAS